MNRPVNGEQYHNNMTRQDFTQIVRQDLFRYDGRKGFGGLLSAWLYETGFRITLLMRLRRLFHSHPLTRYGLYHLVAFFHHRTGVRHGVFIKFTTKIGGGLYLPHALNIVVNHRCQIGSNCNLSQSVTLGAANRGDRAGSPTIGDKVYIAPGAVIFGAINIGDHAAIGANCVVTKDVPTNGVVVGVPGKIISMNGSAGYINHTLSSSLPSASD